MDAESPTSRNEATDLEKMYTSHSDEQRREGT